MKRQIAFGTAALFCLAATAVAEPCVSATFDRPLPGATDVANHVADVPSARFPGFWQDGRIEGYAYRMYSDSVGILRPIDLNPEWVISVACGRDADGCALEVDGRPPKQAQRIAVVLGQCLAGEDVRAAAFAKTTQPEQAEPRTPPIQAPHTASPIQALQPRAPEPCGSTTLNEATDVARMQRLLVLAGADPGPVDGFLGPKSFKAMSQFVKDANWNTPVQEVIAILDDLLCSRGQNATTGSARPRSRQQAKSGEPRG